MKEKFKRTLTNFKELGQFKKIQGIRLSKEGKYKEALAILSGFSDDKEIKPILIDCHYKTGKAYASERNWSNAQQEFKTLIELGDKRRIVQLRLNLLSNLIKQPPPKDNYYLRGRETKCLRIPNIHQDAYLPEIDYVKCVGVYKWVGDIEAADYWSQLLRRIKRGASEDAKEAGKIAAITLFECISAETSITDLADLIIPVPPDPERLKERKFNIPTLLSETISKYSSIPMFDDVLIKTYSTEKRATSSALNMALDIKQPEEVEGRNILIIDDITTHGHTFLTCGCKLKEAGANQVFAAALAHSEPTSSW